MRVAQAVNCSMDAMQREAILPRTHQVEASSVDWRAVGNYLLWTFAISWVLWMGLRTIGVPLAVRTILAMFGPMLGAVMAGRRLGFAREELGRVRTQLASAARGEYRSVLAFVLLPAILTAGTLFTVAIQGSFQSVRFSTLASQVVLALTFGLGMNLIPCFCEEFGWRGFLLGRLEPLGPIAAAALIGVIWGLWHAPAIVLDGFDYPHHSVSGVGFMLMMTVPFSVILTWLRMSSGSLVAPTIAHASLNAEAGLVFLFVARGDSFLTAPVGLLGLIPLAAFAGWLVVNNYLAPEVDLHTRLDRGGEGLVLGTHPRLALATADLGAVD